MKRAGGIALLVVMHACGQDGSTPAAPLAEAESVEILPLPPLVPEGAFFRDPQGRAVFLRGVNYSHRSKSRPYTGWQKPEHFAQIREWGFNCVRYLLIWDAIEHSPGVIEEDYLDHLEQVLQWAQQQGLYVLLDMHQDLYSPVFGGDGAPAWAAVNDLVEPNQVWTPWPLTYFTTEVRASFDLFWTSEELQGHFIDAWKAVAARAKNYSNVVGYNPFNEPFPGNEWPSAFEAGTLSLFYQKLAAAVLEVDPGARFFLEPAAIVGNWGLPVSLEMPPNASVVYAPHFYDPSFLSGGPYLGKSFARAALAVMRDQAMKYGTPLFVGEFGSLRDHPNALEGMRDHCDMMDYYVAAGWTYWNYNPDPATNDPLEADDSTLVKNGAEHPAMDALVRPYPRAVAGNPRHLSFDLAKRKFILRFTQPDPTQATEIFLPARHFPTFSVTTSGTWTFDEATSILTYWADPDVPVQELVVRAGP